jgi:hypothetical protein
MDDKLFKQKLSEVADWRIPKIKLDSNQKDKIKRRVGRPSADDILEQALEREYLEAYGGINPTMAPELVRMRSAACECSDCGKVCENGRHLEKRQYECNNKRHWRERCVTCGLWQNPYTNKFDLTNGKVSVIWNTFMRDTKMVYKSKGNQIKQSDLPCEEIQTDTGIIRIYPDKEHDE